MYVDYKALGTIGMAIQARLERLERAVLYVYDGTSGSAREGQVALQEIREEEASGNNPDRAEAEP